MTNLDWFDFETRIRQLIVTLLEPLTSKQTEDREFAEKLHKKLKTNKSSISEVRSLLDIDSSKTGWMASVDKKLESLAEEIKANQVDCRQSYDEMMDRDKAQRIEINNLKTELSSQESHILILQDKLTEIHSTFEANKQTIFNFLETFKEEAQKNTENILKEFISTQNVANHALKKSEHAVSSALDLEAYMKKIDSINKDTNQYSIFLAEVKCSKDEYNKGQAEIKESLEIFSKRLQKFEDNSNDMLRYLQAYAPIEIDTLVSKNLISFMSNKSVQRWLKFHYKHKQELHDRITNFQDSHDLQALIKRTVEFDVQTESTISEIHREVDKSKYEGKILYPSASIPQIVIFNESLPKEQKPSTPLEETPKTFVEEEEFLKVQSELKNLCSQVSSNTERFSEINGLRRDVELACSDIKKYVSYVIEDTENSLKNRRNERKLFDQEIIDLAGKLTQVNNKITTKNQEIENLGDLCACLTEFSLISHALLLQEEQDRTHLTQNTRQRKKSDHLPSVPGMPKQSYNPTQLSYRNKIYSRIELIEVMGKLLQSGWGTVSSKLPYHSRRSSMDEPKTSRRILKPSSHKVL